MSEEIDFEDLLEHYSFMIRDDRINSSKTIKIKDFIECMKDGEWKEIKEMVQEVYGKMPEMQITVEADDDTKEEASKIIRGFALP